MPDIIANDLIKDKGFIKFINQILDKQLIKIKIINFKQAQKIAKYIANLPPSPLEPESTKEQQSPMMIEMAINELLINAIEHGLLKINYDDKTRLLAEKSWDKHVDTELSKLPKDKYVTITFKLDKDNNNLQIAIIDPGDGFNPKNNKAQENKLTTAQHGRGIALAKTILGEDNVKYLDRDDNINI